VLTIGVCTGVNYFFNCELSFRINGYWTGTNLCDLQG
jgi:hypothetical protein